MELWTDRRREETRDFKLRRISAIFSIAAESKKSSPQEKQCQREFESEQGAQVLKALSFIGGHFPHKKRRQPEIRKLQHNAEEREGEIVLKKGKTIFDYTQSLPNLGITVDEIREKAAAEVACDRK
ncbi:MAG: hypothetical protein HGB11_15290 [Chlorobiales bacterium]|nr:hypothetical protein [Chlorobiales bacterium]